MSLSILKVAGMMIVLLAGNLLWLRYQQRELNVLRTQNTQLITQSEVLQTRLLQLKVQAAGLSTTLSEQQAQQHQLEEFSEQTRRQLRQVVSLAPCADQPVPADVIRLQRDALHRRPLSNRGDTTASSGSLSNTGLQH